MKRWSLLVLGLTITACGSEFTAAPPTDVDASAGGTGGSTAGSGGEGGTGDDAGTGATAGSGGAGGATGGSGGEGGATGGSGGEGGATGGTGGTPPDGGAPEDCMNGVDDDTDGLTDCEDPDCTPGFTCVPKPPVDWQGVGPLLEGVSDSCPQEFPVGRLLFDAQHLPQEPALCFCSCGGPTGHCQSELTLSDSCTNPSGSGAAATNVACTPLPSGSVSSLAVKAGVVKAVTTCVPAGPSIERPQVNWPAAWNLCQQDKGGACTNATQTCIPKPSPASPALCIVHEGPANCPAPYTDRRELWSGAVEDNRGCTAGCTCSSTTSSCACSAGGCGVGVFAGQSCGNQALMVVPTDGTCHSAGLTGVLSTSARLAGATYNPEPCQPSVSTPTGSLVPKEPLTVCCMTP